MAHESGTNNITLWHQKLRPKLIVFDLDDTLWLYTLEYDTHPPFRLQNGTVFDAKGKAIHPFPEVSAILKFLNQHKFRIAIASRCSIRPSAEQLIGLLGWTDYFQHLEMYSKPKTEHFSELHVVTKIPFEDMLFFDDDKGNINNVSKLGVTCIHVDDREGVTWQNLQEGFNAFAEKKNKANKCR